MNNRQNEVKTTCARDFKINLSTADFDRLYEKAESVGLTPSQLLENFIGDLVCGTYTNGSDERMYANQWFDRCGFSYLERPKSFLGWLLEYNTGDTICSYAMDWLFVKEYEDNLEELDRNELNDMLSIKEELESDFAEYRSSKYAISDTTLENEMQKIVEYRNERQKALGNEEYGTVPCESEAEYDYEME